MSTAESDVSRPPALRWFVTEPLRGAISLARLPLARTLLNGAPPGDGRGVLVLPGLLADDVSTRPLRGFLRRLDHRVYGWGLGRNRGPTPDVVEGLPRRLEHVAERTGQPVSLVGWSLGGILARELARRQPDLVQQVITLASPYMADETMPSRADAAYRRGSTQHVGRNSAASWERMRQPIPVPSTAVYSRTDGIVHWRACISPADATHENVEVRAGHLGIGVDAAVLWLLADRLAQPVGEWAPFEPPATMRLMFPR
ncbi:MAG: alpha/beta fold hydrolase [Aeromicrobium sp.]